MAQRKHAVERFVDQVINRGDLRAVEELCTPEAAAHAVSWVAPFRVSFPDVHMETVQFVAEEHVVVGRFRCSGTHLGEWLGHPPTGRRFEGIDEVYFFTFEGTRIARYWGIEDTVSRLRQLGIPPS